MRGTPLCLATDPEWKQYRKSGIGASEAPAACMISRYSTPLDVYERKTGNSSDESTDNVHMRFGRFMEPAIVRMYEDEYQKNLTYPLPMCRHSQWPFMLATPDAQEDERTGIEIKTVDERYARSLDVVEREISETFPEYFIQAQVQCAVMDWDLVKVVMLIGKRLHVFPVSRDDEMIQMIADCEAALWSHIERRVPPSPTHPADLDVLRRHKRISGPVVPLSNDIASRWERYEWCGRLIKTLKARQDLLKAEVLFEIGDAPGGLLPDGEHMIARSIIRKKGYSVAPSESLDVRKKKYDGSPLAVSQTLPVAS